MKAVLACLAVTVTLTVAATARGQQPTPAPTPTPRPIEPRRTTPFDQEISLGQLTPTPEMWFYEQAMRQYNDPRASIRRKAEFESEQRRLRLAAMRWYGFSNSRPTANPLPYHSTYSPTWSSNTLLPFQWSGAVRTPQVQPRYVYGGPRYGLW